VPAEVRAALALDYEQVQSMLEKLEHGHIHIAACGRVSVGKSATLNALLGAERFSTSPLHGETKRAQIDAWEEYQSGGVFLIDTPGLNEVDGEARERLAHEVASRSDLVLFIVDGDLTESELRALRLLTDLRRPVLLVFNKVDRYTRQEREILLTALRHHSEGHIDPRNIVCVSAKPAERLVIRVDEQGHEHESLRHPKPDVQALRDHGFSDEQITIAAQVIGYFNYINRIADGLGVDDEPEMAPACRPMSCSAVTPMPPLG